MSDKPITRLEQYLAALAGEAGDIPDKPVTRVEQYLAAILESGGGGGGGGGGGESVIAWKPTVSADGTISWTRTASTAKPADQNIKGDPGDDGAPGAKGDKGDKGDPGDDGTDGVSPTVTIATITGGHRVTITDRDHPEGQSFDVLDGEGGGTADSVDWSKVTNKPTDLVQDANYQHITVDDGLDEDSKNPLQNRVLHGIFESQRQVMEVMQGKITANETALADRYTKTETDAKIADELAQFDKLDYEIVTELPTTGASGVRYLVKHATDNQFEEYIYVNDAWHDIGSTSSVDLTGYATEDFVTTKTAKMGEFDVTPIPQGPTGANEINTVLSNKDNEYTRLSYVRQSDGTLPNTVNLGVKSGIGEDSFELPTKALVDSKAALNVVPGDDKVDVTQGSTGFGLRADNGGLVFDIAGSDIMTLQQKLESGTNIKTVNGVSLLGSGNIPISGGSGSLPQGGYKGQALVKQSTADGDAVWGTPSFDTYFSESSINAIQNKVVTSGLKTRAVGWIDRKNLSYFYTNDGEESTLPTKEGQILEVESGIGFYRATLTQADIDGINAATASAGHFVRVYFEYDEADYYDIEVKNTGAGKGYYGLNTGNPDPDYSHPSLPGNVYSETIYQIDKRLIPGGSGAVDQTYDATSANAQSGKAVAEALANNPIGTHFEVGAEKWYGTYTADGVTYQVYSKLLNIGALPSAAGAAQYPHGITGINQILQISGFTNDGFVMNAPRQNAQDNISIYQAQKSGNIVVEVGKDRSSKTGFVMLIYAKNN